MSIILYKNLNFTFVQSLISKNLISFLNIKLLNFNLDIPYQGDFTFCIAKKVKQKR